MALLSMNEMTTYRWSFEEDVNHYAAAGIPAIGVWRRKLADFGEDRGRELLSDSGLSVSNLLWAGGFTGSDGHTFRESLDDAVDAVRLAASIGAKSLVVYSGARAGHTHNHARRLTTDALKELAPLAAELKIVLAIEPMHAGCAAEWTFLTSVEDALSLLDVVNSPSVRLAFDSYHCGANCKLAALESWASRIAIVHLGDGKHAPDREQSRSRIGEGCIPLKEIVSALAAGGYDGYYDVELMGEEIETADYQELLQHSKMAFAELLR